MGIFILSETAWTVQQLKIVKGLKFNWDCEKLYNVDRFFLPLYVKQKQYQSFFFRIFAGFFSHDMTQFKVKCHKVVTMLQDFVKTTNILSLYDDGQLIQS